MLYRHRAIQPVLALACGLFLYRLSAAGGPYTLSFWPANNASDSARAGTIQEHPCGKIVVARVTKMPAVGSAGPLIPELVVETNTRGSVVRRWPFPVDASPVAIEGSRVLAEYEDGKIWITPQGEITPYNGTTRLPATEAAACGRLPEFRKSAFLQCRKFRDLKSGQFRTLNFEGPCT